MASAELITRIKTAAIAGAVALLLVLWSQTSFAFLILIAACLLAMEWQRLMDLSEQFPPIWGLLYIAFPCLCLILLRQESVTATLHLFFIVWATDIGAYFAGRTIGGPKLWPRISPSKTWAGLMGAIIAAALTAALLSSFAASGFNMILWAFAGGILAIVAQAGDFFASWLKRKADVKDSGDLLPGHGGLLDRVDGLLFAAPVYLLIFGAAHA